MATVPDAGNLPRPSGFQTKSMWLKGPRRSGTYANYLSWWKQHQAAQKSKAATSGKPPAPTIVPKGPQIKPLTSLRSTQDLTKLATSQVDAELAGQVNPLETQASTTAAREAAARQELEQMFGSIQPAISDALHITSDNFDKTRLAEQALFAQAGQRLNDLKQGAAADAQQLAQQIGGPVAVDKFTGNIDPSIASFAAEAPNQQIHDIGIGQAGVEQMASWAGRVFPLIRVQKQLETRQGYEDKIAEIQGQIATLKGQRGTNIDTRLNDLLEKERAYQLQLAQQNLDKVKAAHDWAATQHTLKNDDARLALAGYQARTGVQLKDAEIRLKAQQLTASQLNQAKKLRMSAYQFAQKLLIDQGKLKVQQDRVKLQQQRNAYQMAKAIANPSSLKPITVTQRVNLTPEQERLAKRGKIKGAIWDNVNNRYYIYQKHTMMPAAWLAQRFGDTAQGGTRDPQKMFKLLRAAGIPPALARQAVKTELGHWQPKKKKKK